MDFSYSEEQRMLTDSLRRLMADRWTYSDRRTRQKAGVLDQSAWANLAELGVSGLLVPEEFGGFGESPATMLAVHHELGRGLVSEPVISSAVMAVTLALLLAVTLPIEVTGVGSDGLSNRPALRAKKPPNLLIE